MRARITITTDRGSFSVNCKPVEGDRFLELDVLGTPGTGASVRDCWCPTCATMYAYRSGVIPGCASVPGNPGTVRGLSARLGALLEQREVLTRQWGPLELEDPPYAPARVILPRPQEYSHGYRGTAECERCRQPIGELVIETSLFGHDEDRAVLESGRFRVY
jgi:hypothetical protein